MRANLTSWWALREGVVALGLAPKRAPVRLHVFRLTFVAEMGQAREEDPRMGSYNAPTARRVAPRNAFEPAGPGCARSGDSASAGHSNPLYWPLTRTMRGVWRLVLGAWACWSLVRAGMVPGSATRRRRANDAFSGTAPGTKAPGTPKDQARGTKHESFDEP